MTAVARTEAAGAPPATRGDRIERLAVMAVAAGATTLYAVEGGTYDVVARGEAGIVIWWVLALGVALGLLPRSGLRREGWLVLGGLAALLVWNALALGWTESEERTSVELARIAHHLGFLALALALLGRRTATAAVAGAAAGAAVVCGIAVASRLYPEVFPEDVVRRSFGGNRLSYPLNYWNATAAWGAMATALTLAWGTHAARAAWRAVAMAAVPVCVTAVYLSYSRAGAAGVALGILLVLASARTRAVVVLQAACAGGASFLVIHAIRRHEGLVQATGTEGRGWVLLLLAVGMAAAATSAVALAALGADRRLRVPRRPALAAGVVAAIVAVGAAAVVLPPLLDGAWDEFRGDRATNVDPSDPAARLGSLNGNRYNVYASALDAWRAEPLGGTGPGTFEYWWSRDAVHPESVRDAHSLYLEALAETGWPGLALVVLVCAAALAAAISRRRHARDQTETAMTVAVLAGFGVWLLHAGVDWMWELTAVTVLALLLAAAACTGDRPGGRVPIRYRVPLVAAAILLIAVQLPPVVGTSEVRASQRAIAADDPRRALAEAQDAVDAWPWASTPLVQRALVLERSGDLRSALEDARRAERREPTNWRLPLLVARLEAQRGNPRRALTAFRRARRLRPLAAVFR